MSVQLAAQDFTTPNKGSGFPLAAMSTSTKPFKSVTPMDTGITVGTAATNKVIPHLTSVAMNAAAGKHVRFGAEQEDTSKDSETATSKRGLVSRRGGRYVSPGRPLTAANASTPKEGAFCTPKASTDDSVPALCSTNSVGIVSLPSECENAPKQGTPKRPAQLKGEAYEEDAANAPSSISCGGAMHITSPLASTRKDALSFDDADSKSYVRSPVPSTSCSDRFKKTPTKSPSHFQSLPPLDDPKLNSPVGFILSPGGPNTPSYKTMRDAFEKEDKDDKDDSSLSEKIRDYTKEKFALTPTNFSLDYGRSSTTFDTSNVLNWLQSPTANGLFSPGGLNSIMNTPKGPLIPRTPGTPSVSTSFFFSDVAGLARGDTPKRGDETAKSPKKGLSNIICISPLASSRSRGTAHAANTPINYNDIFASPNPLLEDSPPTKASLLQRPTNGKNGSTNDPSLDAMHNAERDLMQDEDLSVLLQLAGGNTPRGADRSGKASGGHVFRAGSRKGDDPSDRENLPGLQLPIIGDRQGDSSAARLARKSHARDPNEKDSFVKPTLGIRKTSSKAHKENNIDIHPGKALAQEEIKPNQVLSKSTISKPLTTGSHPYPQHSHPYPPRPPTSDMYSGYPSMPPHGMRPSGRMSVVVGGPPPSSRAPKANPAPRSHMTPAHRRPSYSSQDTYPPPGMSYPPPPHHGHYPPHPVHMGAMGGHPYHSHYAPPPRHHAPPPHAHLPMYASQHHAAPTSKISPAKKSKASKAAKQQQQQHHLPLAVPSQPNVAKRPSISSDSGKPAKKAKKSTSTKRKNKSPQLTEKADRQRAAQTIAAVNAASGGKNDKAAALAAAILRGVTMRPSGKWQAQLYFAGKSRYIGVFDTREKAALAYEIAREKLKSEKSAADGALTPKQTENAVNAARKAAFDGVNEKDPRLGGK